MFKKGIAPLLGKRPARAALVTLLVSAALLCRWRLSGASRSQATSSASSANNSRPALVVGSAETLPERTVVQVMIKCDGCKKKILLTTANTILFLYEQQVWFSWIMTTCECNEEHRNFVEPEVVRLIITDSVCGIVHEQYAPPEIVANYEETFHVTMPKTYALLPRHEAEISHLAEVLANTPDDLLMDCLTYPPPKSTMPLRWAN